MAVGQSVDCSVAYNTYMQVSLLLTSCVAADATPTLKWGAPDEQGLVEFLVKEKGFNEDRIRKAVQRINASKGKASQGRLEAFFGPVIKAPSSNSSPAKGPNTPAGKGEASGVKRKLNVASSQKGKMGKGSGNSNVFKKPRR